MDKLRSNLNFLFGIRQTNPHAAATEIGVSQPTLHRLLTQAKVRPSAATLHRLASFFDVTVDALLSDDLTEYPPAQAPRQQVVGEAPAPHYNVRSGPDITGLVPLLSSVQAGEWCEVAAAFEREDAQEWLPCPVRHGPRTFCLVVEGESMKNPGIKPSYEPGDIIFIDPDKVANPGDRVVARLENQPAATFKQYWEEDGKRMLKALNPDWNPRYSPINDDATICGVVIGKWVPE
ncbi:helix-turn-helix domain-containing protein [Alcaligenaceae bacterium]|nr:helix-turn-helix domain-containing protein [Alcaligenaceae bacterium]